MKPQRPIKNVAEAECMRHLENLGATVSKCGWPDFFAFDANGAPMAVEVKRRRSTPLKESQWRVMAALQDAGVACYRYDPDDGLQTFDRDAESAKAVAGRDGRLAWEAERDRATSLRRRHRAG